MSCPSELNASRLLAETFDAILYEAGITTQILFPLEQFRDAKGYAVMCKKEDGRVDVCISIPVQGPIHLTIMHQGISSRHRRLAKEIEAILVQNGAERIQRKA